ncbi:MAG: hypothetical protein IKE63_06710 [Bacilli bacterium]|nr:hypothetical protein [Bacilli bacterium]
MQKVYIILTYTGTILAKLVRGYTRKEYAHVSLALDKDLNEMYSFGRLNPYNPFIGGFVHESIDYGTFKRFSKTKTKIYSLEVNDEQYNQMKKIIEDINNNKNNYRFNVLGIFFAAVHLKLKRERCFYCAEFVKYVLENSDLKIDLPEIVKPDDFNKIADLQEIYTGVLKYYKM